MNHFHPCLLETKKIQTLLRIVEIIDLLSSIIENNHNDWTVQMILRMIELLSNIIDNDQSNCAVIQLAREIYIIENNQNNWAVIDE